MRYAYLIGSLILLTAPVGAGSEDRPFIDVHVRCLDRQATRLVAEATGLSPTVRQLIAEIERSDVIVYVRLDTAIDRYTADTRLLTSVPGARYALIELNPLSPEGDLIPLLGHELWHAVEIARAKDVHNANDMRRLFRQLGWSAAKKDRCETRAAVLVGRQVRLELAAAGKPVESLVGGQAAIAPPCARCGRSPQGRLQSRLARERLRGDNRADTGAFDADTDLRKRRAGDSSSPGHEVVRHAAAPVDAGVRDAAERQRELPDDRHPEREGVFRGAHRHPWI